MMTGQLLTVEPSNLEFFFELKEQLSCSLQLSNETDHYVAFKVKTTHPKKYCVRPNVGIIVPGSTCDVTVVMQAQAEAPANMKCEDKFLVVCVKADEGATTKDITSDMFYPEAGNVVQKLKLGVIYVLPSEPPSPVQEGSSPSSPASDNGRANVAETSSAPITLMDGLLVTQDISPEEKVVRPQLYSLDELREATNNFSDDNILGEGSFGVVYRGCLADGSDVAIKRLHPRNLKNPKKKDKNSAVVAMQFLNELSIPAHPNLLPIIGFCTTMEEKLLVTPLMVNGSLASHLGSSTLDWNRRKVIAFYTAAALAYLHDHCHIIHRDIKPDNILLDENYTAVVADCGLARYMDPQETHVSTFACGTRGHIAPEYAYDNVCSEKTDVYAYGILLLEIIIGRHAWDLVPDTESMRVSIPDWFSKEAETKEVSDFIDANLLDNAPLDQVELLLFLALGCMQKSPEKRPEMSDVVGFFLSDIAEISALVSQDEDES